MFTVLVQFGGLDGLMHVFRDTDMDCIRKQIRQLASVMGTAENEIQILCSKTPSKRTYQ